MNDPIIYREVLARGRRTFELFDDRVLIRVQYPNNSSELTVDLSNIRPTPNTVRIRQWPFNHGLIAATCPWSYIGAKCAFSGIAPSIDAMTIAGAISFVGAVICLYCIRKIEFASFVTHAGTVVLDVGDAGPDREIYRSFVDGLIQRIAANQPTK